MLLVRWYGLPRHLNGTEQSILSQVTSVLVLLWDVKMSVVKEEEEELLY